MDAAKPDEQLQRHGRRVPWTDSFVEDIKRSLLTCRVLYVDVNSILPPNLTCL
jgi:POT family proton-dependent oligopeptide transporter